MSLMTVQTEMPPSFDAGTAVKYTRSYPNFRADQGWTLKLLIRGKLTRDIPATTNANGRDFDIVIPATGVTGTAGLNPDTYEGLLYQFHEVVEHTGAPADGPYTVEKGSVWVGLDFSAAAAGVAQLVEEKELAIVNAAIQGRLTTDMESYQFEGRAVVRISVQELYTIRRRLVATIKAKRNRGKFSTPIRQVFQRPSPVWRPPWWGT